MFSSLIAPALGLAGSLFGASSASSGQKATNVANAKQAALNREFQAGQARLQFRRYKNLAGSEYQRAMKDMRKAGLNPILAYQQGGASTSMGASPSGAQAVMQNPDALSSQLISQGVNSAFSNYRTLEETERVRADVKKIESEIDKNDTISNLNRVLKMKGWAEVDNLGQQHQILQQTLRNMGITEQKLRSELDILNKQAGFARITEEMLQKSPDLRTLSALMEILGFRLPYQR